MDGVELLCIAIRRGESSGIGINRKIFMQNTKFWEKQKYTILHF